MHNVESNSGAHKNMPEEESGKPVSNYGCWNGSACTPSRAS